MRTRRALQIIHPNWSRRDCIISIKQRQRNPVMWIMEKQFIQKAALLKLRGLQIYCNQSNQRMTWEGVKDAFHELGVSIKEATKVFGDLGSLIEEYNHRPDPEMVMGMGDGIAYVTEEGI